MPNEKDIEAVLSPASETDERQLFAKAPLANVAADLSDNVVLEAEKIPARHLFTYADAERLKRRADFRLLPLFVLAYLIKNIDANLISYVKTMNSGTDRNIITQLNMTTDDYSYLATAFTASFALLEVPANAFIKKATPRLQFVRIIGSWSIIVACTAACTNSAGLYVCRFLLGVAEAGLWSGVIYHIYCWYRPDEAAARLAIVTMMGQFSGIIDALLCYGLDDFEKLGLCLPPAPFISTGIAGWRWAFIICGLFGMVIAGLIFVFMPDWPDSPPSFRQFLSPEEGLFMASRLPPGASRAHDINWDWPAIKHELRSPLLYGFAFMGILNNTGTTGVTFWLPTITSSFNLTSGASAQLLNIGPSGVFVVTAVLTGFWLDYTVRISKFVPLLGGFIGCMCCYFGLIFCQTAAGKYVLILVAYMFNAAAFVSLWPLRSQTIRGSSQSAFIFAFTNTIQNSAGLYSAQIFRAQYAPTYAVPFAICIVFIFLSILMCIFNWWLMYDVEKQTRVVGAERRKVGKHDNAVYDQDIVVHERALR